MSEKIAVHTPTKESYDRLMKAYEKKGWTWMNGGNPTTQRDYESRGDAKYIRFCDKFMSTDMIKEYTIITVEEALARLGQYERGQEVRVSTNGYNWFNAIYLCTIDGAYRPYICADDTNISLYKVGGKFHHSSWQYIKPLEEPIKEMTMQEVETALGHKVKIVK